MTTLDDQQQIVNLLEDALTRVCEATRIQQRMSHQPRPSPHYKNLEDDLERLLSVERAMLKRLQTVGR